MSEQRLKWFRQLKSISQYGLTYSKDPYDRERFEAVAAVATEIARGLTGADEVELELEHVLGLELGPPSPKLDVRAAVFKGDAVLLVREATTARGLCRAVGSTRVNQPRERPSER